MTPEQMAAAQELLKFMAESGILKQIQQHPDQNWIWLAFMAIGGVSFVIGRVFNFHRETLTYRKETRDLLDKVHQILQQIASSVGRRHTDT